MTEPGTATDPDTANDTANDTAAPSGPAGPDRPTGGSGSPTWARYLLVAGGAVALLLLGAAAGMLIGLPGSTSVPVPGPDSVDVGFAQDMSVHHEQAVRMATWERDHTTDPQLRQLAFDIETGQSRQIGYLQGWLGLWGASNQSPDGYMRWMPADGPGMSGMSGMSGRDTSAQPGAAPAGDGVPGGGVARMPGMASDQEIRELTTSTGPAMDTLFLRLMLRHHQGGAGMLNYAARAAQQPEVRNLASQMLTSQTGESDYMDQLLAARGAAPLPAG
ncbi:MAG TPA: DUF305 domain-containing protein [Pseudonocardia sp.]|nr:DUF305 domain-containing protein [Pseudonocardia sp.]